MAVPTNFVLSRYCTLASNILRSGGSCCMPLKSDQEAAPSTSSAATLNLAQPLESDPISLGRDVDKMTLL
jgi:hypothetical protein